LADAQYLMSTDILRQAIYAALVIMMGVTLWVTAWASQLEARARLGWLPPLQSQQP
jgi:hypothetical protein